MKNVMRRSVIFALALLMMLTVVILPQNKAYAKSKPWYGKYWELSKTAKKSIKIKGNKVYLKGKWENTSSRYGSAKAKKIKKTFKLTSKTKYYFEYDDSDKAKKVSKKKFKKYLYSDVTFCSLKVSKGKVVKAYLSFN
ncbi:MAG: hypothetical protein IJH41_02005 [Eubacterium sp.]|nr:hypothetical protein [Eubacterium sp.]